MACSHILKPRLNLRVCGIMKDQDMNPVFDSSKPRSMMNHYLVQRDLPVWIESEIKHFYTYKS